MRNRQRDFRRLWLGSLLGSALVAVPIVGAGGIDNDSPFTLPAFSSGAGTGSLTSTTAGGIRGLDHVEPLVPEVGPGSSLVFGSIAKGELHTVLARTKLVTPGQLPREALSSAARLRVPTGQQVVIVDSAPELGDFDVEADGVFELIGNVDVTLDLGMPMSGVFAFLVIGNGSPDALIPQSIEAAAALPIDYGVIDVESIASALAGHPELLGKDAAVVVVRLSHDLSGKTSLKSHGIVRFEIGRARRLVDTTAHVID